MSAPLLLTGSTGYLGRHVLTALRAALADRRVYSLVRDPAEWPKLDYAADNPHVVAIKGDLVDDLAWMDDPALADVGGVLHLAALVNHSRRDSAPVTRTNVEGTLNVVKFAARSRTPVVFVSTSGTVACFRKPGQVVYEEAPYAEGTVGRWPYYASKIQAERQARALAAETGVPLTIMRPPVLLGPGDHRFRSTGHVLRMLRGRLPFLIDGGISYCDVRDVAAAVVAALDHPARRPIYHLPGHDMTIGTFFGLVEELSGTPAPKRYLPYRAAKGLAVAAERTAHSLGQHSPLPDPVVIEMARHHWGIASRHVEGELGYRIRDARETLRHTIGWLRQHHPELRGPDVATAPDGAGHGL